MSSTMPPVPGMGDDLEAGRALIGELSHTDYVGTDGTGVGEWW